MADQAETEVKTICNMLVATLQLYPQGVDDHVAFETLRSFTPNLRRGEFTRIINMLALFGKIRRHNRVMYPVNGCTSCAYGDEGGNNE